MKAKSNCVSKGCIAWVKRYFLFLILIALPISLTAQDTPIPPDTIFANLQAEAEDAILHMDRLAVKQIGQQIRDLGKEHQRAYMMKWGAYYQAEGLFREDPTEAEKLTTEAMAYFEAQQDLLQIGRCYNILASAISNLNDHRGGIKHYHTAIEYFKKAKRANPKLPIKRRIAAAQSNIGHAYIKLSQFDEAANFLFEAEKVAQELGEPILLGGVTNNLGNVFFLAERWEESRKYYHKLRDLGIKYDHKPFLRLGLMGIGNTFFNLGNLDSSLFYQHKSIDLLRSSNDIVSLSINLSNLANTYGAMENCHKADSISLEVVQLAQEHKMPQFEALSNYTMAECAMARKDYKRAIELSQLSLAMMKESGDLDFLRDLYGTLYSAYEGKKNFDLALEYHRKFKLLSDSILNDNSLSKIQELKTRYETERKEREIEQLNETNRIQQLEYRQSLSWLIIFLIALGMLGVIYFFYNRQKILLTNNQKLEIEQRLLRSQMNPHFIFNALTSIQTFLLQDGQAQKGVLYLSKFAKLIRRILEHSRVTFVPLADELETLEHYLSLQQLRFEQQFKYEILVDPLIDMENVQFPPMLLQPTIENAIEHGQLAQVNNGTITIEVKQEQPQLLRIEVRDNGIGRKAAKAKQLAGFNHKSLSSMIIKERILLLQKTYNQQTSSQITDPPEGGTIVSYLFPLKPQATI